MAARSRKALRLSPLDDPLNYHPYCALALTGLFSGRLDEAVAYAEPCQSELQRAYVYLVAAHAHLGDLEAARSAARRLLEVAPSFTIGGFARMNLFRPTLMEGITRSHGKAGLPS